MNIQKIRLTDFRNFKSKLFEFSPQTTVILGPNASGKTNILEGLFVLATGKSFRARIEEEMIKYSSEIARVKGRISSKSSTSSSAELKTLEVVLTRGFLNVGNSRPEKVAKKKLLVNKVAKRLIDFAGNFRVVLFGPWDLDLVTASPSLRRNFLDTVLSQVDREYRRASLSYEKGLRQRNRVLLSIREDPSTPFSRSGRERLLFWDRLLIKNGDYINQCRREFLDFANTGNFQFPRLRRGFGGQAINNFQLEYDPSTISEARLEQYAEEEVAAATTLVGPHRDDFVFKVTSNKKQVTRELARFGSRGEQRMSVLWLKLVELAFIQEKTRSTGAATELSRMSSGQAGEKPILLLDDIFSELDHEHRKIVMETIKGQQTLITTADPHFVEHMRIDSLIKL